MNCLEVLPKGNYEYIQVSKFYVTFDSEYGKTWISFADSFELAVADYIVKH